MFTNLPSIGPQCDLLTWCIFVLLCFANTLTCVFFCFRGPTFTDNSSWRKLSGTSETGTRRTVKLAGKLLCTTRSQKQHNRCWPLIGHQKYQSQTSIQMGISCRTSSLRLASQGSLTRSWKLLPLFSLTQLTAPRTPRMYYSYNRLTFGKKQRDGTWFHCYSSELFILTAIHVPQLKKKKTKFKTQLSSKTMTLKIYCHIWAIQVCATVEGMFFLSNFICLT